MPVPKPVPYRLATPQQPVRRALYSAATPIARRARSKTRYPAVGVGGAAALDVDELALEHFGDLARPAGADREARVSARHLAHRGHDSRGAEGEALGQTGGEDSGCGEGGGNRWWFGGGEGMLK